MTQALLNFRRLGLLSIIVVYMVILAGGIVRASGAGMGCPDWPTCFGQLIPPTLESELPVNWRDIYAKGDINARFNAVKTWTEFTNRMIGVTLGILFLLTAFAARVYLKTDKTVFYLSLFAVFLVGFQGWMGAQVVASDLQPIKITVHMLLALAIVGLMIYTIARSQREFLQSLDSSKIQGKVKTVLIAAICMTLFQVAMGTQIRETVDFITNQHEAMDRSFWREDFPVIFYIHRSFSSIILFTNLWIAWKIHRSGTTGLLLKTSLILMGLVVTAILAGVSLDRLGMPPIAQPVHLLMANLIFGMQFFLYICLTYSEKNVLENPA
jgi:cytochrome c oxidase assembly protein subunit 15